MEYELIIATDLTKINPQVAPAPVAPAVTVPAISYAPVVPPYSAPQTASNEVTCITYRIFATGDKMTQLEAYMTANGITFEEVF